MEFFVQNIVDNVMNDKVGVKHGTFLVDIREGWMIQAHNWVITRNRSARAAIFPRPFKETFRKRTFFLHTRSDCRNDHKTTGHICIGDIAPF